ncbi:unnamed protein product [Heterosigma akashiwo]
MLTRRAELPAWEKRAAAAALVAAHPVVLVAGDTGCGKSTQVPQFLLDDADQGPGLRAACTQPRRISAVSVAERVAEERGEQIGQMVGYAIRLDAETSRDTQLTFVTPGILLRRLHRDPTLSEYTHIFIDEVHERDRNSEFLLIVLRDLLAGPRRGTLKVVLMSATLQISKYSGKYYFGGCPVLTIGGRCHPVQEFFLEDALLQTGYLEAAGVPAAGAAAAGGSAAAAVFGAAVEGFFCALCQGRAAAFRSPEELGTHAAFCGAGLAPAALRQRLSGFDRQNAQAARALLEELGGLDPAAGGGGDGGAVEEEDDEEEGEEEEEEEEDPESQKWDGARPFLPVTLLEEDPAAAAAVAGYQTAFDDTLVDYDLITALLGYICRSAYEDGAVLVFLPGWDDIMRQKNLLLETPPFNDSRRFVLHLLHSGVPTSEQRKAFRRPPPGVRKLILATNIAETSITIDDVAFVINSGRVKEKNYDPHLRLTTLESVWTSKASAIQRKGRAGRVRAGVCFHLFSRTRFSSLKDVQESELLRTPLEELLLQAKAMGVAEGGAGSLGEFLQKAVDPPHPKAVRNAVELLTAVGALDDQEGLTELGARLAAVALDPKLCKVVLWSYLFGCAGPALTIGCALASRDPFMLPYNDEQKKRAKSAKFNLSLGMESDFIALLQAIQQWDQTKRSRGAGGAYRWAEQQFLMPSCLTMVSDVCGQIANDFQRGGYPNPRGHGWWNDSDRSLGLLSNIVGIGLYPNLAQRRAGDQQFSTKSGQKAKINQGSVNALRTQRLAQPCARDQELLAFADLSRSSYMFMMSNTCPVEPLALVLFSGSLEVVGTEPGGGGAHPQHPKRPFEGGGGGGRRGGGHGGPGAAQRRRGSFNASSGGGGGGGGGHAAAAQSHNRGGGRGGFRSGRGSGRRGGGGARGGRRGGRGRR